MEFPTHVGMNRLNVFFNLEYDGVPHTCGDEPAQAGSIIGIVMSSPHMWG